MLITLPMGYLCHGSNSLHLLITWIQLLLQMVVQHLFQKPLTEVSVS